jgi:hypothetical protein
MVAHGRKHIHKSVDGAFLDAPLHDIIDARLCGMQALGGFPLSEPVLLDVLLDLNHELRTQLQILRIRQL